MADRLLDETGMLAALRSAKKILLIEPEYRRKYIPLGLAKISTYAKEHGAETRFARYWFGGQFDLVCVSSLFTWTSETVLRKLRIFEAQKHVKRIIVGGIYASLMPEHILKGTSRCEIFTGTSPALDGCIPDYETDWALEIPEWLNWSYVFTTRGCPNKCAYCVVWRMEKNHIVIPNWREHILEDRPNVIIGDNNLCAAPKGHFQKVFAYLAERKKGVIIDSGLDCRRIGDPEIKAIASVKYPRQGCRMAFDSMAVDGIWQRAADKLLAAGILGTDMMSFVLFNFNDTPAEAMYRMTECHKRRIWGYPQLYTPLNKTDRSEQYIGKHWTRNMLKIFRAYWLLRCRTVPFVDWLEGDFAKRVQGYKLSSEEFKALTGKVK